MSREECIEAIVTQIDYDENNIQEEVMIFDYIASSIDFMKAMFNVDYSTIYNIFCLLRNGKE